uniref:GLOBIN domain-containing protein n=1 Tax=Ascaris lumbricoides TaxID=6252 RepID=A0A0M3I410_ASCLU
MQGIFSSIRGAISHDAMKSSQPEALTNKEKKILIQQWTTMIEHNPDLFKKAWIRSSQRSTSIKKAFGMEENEDPEKNEIFMRLPNTIEAFFKNLLIDCECDEKKIRQKCEQMGARHIDFSVRGFHSNFWDIFLVIISLLFQSFISSLLSII